MPAGTLAAASFHGRPLASQQERFPLSIETLPVVSVIMANYNGSRFLAAALATATRQTLSNIEVIVIDDASIDDSVVIARNAAALDPRIRVLARSDNGGPAAARNLGLATARGVWIAVMDSDDLMHPNRLARLVAVAEREHADIVADDLLMFHDDSSAAPRRFLPAHVDGWIDAARYIRANRLFSGSTLGYLKPLMRAALIREGGHRYDPALRIAEDYYFVTGLLLAGGRFRITRDLTYFYRRHGSSISHRLSRLTLEPMLAADAALRAGLTAPTRDIIGALDAVRASVRTALIFDDLIAALKRRHIVAAARIALTNPRAGALLRQPISARLVRLFARKPAAAHGRGRSALPSICVVTRQRVLANSNGSSAYLLSLCGALRRRGHAVHLLCPSPATFGRRPWLRYGVETETFSSINMHGAWQFNTLFVARDPAIALRALLTVLDRLGARMGLGGGNRIKPAPYAVALPWTDADRLWVARHAPPLADVVIADYAFLTEAIAFALRPDSPSAVVMHDLFSSRSKLSGKGNDADALVEITLADELALLARADAVIAIQAHEAASIGADLPHTRVITAPMASRPVATPQPGAGDTLFFVGSNTGPNISGLAWFLDHVWPRIRDACPSATLTVAGTVADAFGGARPAEGVTFVGRVDDLATHYRDSAVVISPLRVGSGLKIKLIEGLAHGKAMVATPVTVQGVGSQIEGAALIADDAAEFSAAAVALLRDETRRQQLCIAALKVVATHFSDSACYRDVLAFAESGASSQK